MNMSDKSKVLRIWNINIDRLTKINGNPNVAIERLLESHYDRKSEDRMMLKAIYNKTVPKTERQLKE